MRSLRVGMLVIAMLAVAGCAGSRVVTRPPAGQWYGIVWAMCTEAVQGLEYLDFTLGEDGRWTAVVGAGAGARRVEGTARVERGLLVFEGTVVGRPLIPAYYKLAINADGTLYGMTVLSLPPGKGTFPALVELWPHR